MVLALREGLRLARSQLFALIVIFLLHLAWTLLFYRFIEVRVIDVMKRLPPTELGGARLQLFMNESSLLLERTDLATRTLWILLAYMVIKLVITPMLHAGIYTSILDSHRARGTIFIEGMRNFGGSFTWLYLLRLALTAIPFYWAVPALFRSLNESASILQLVLSLVPWILGIGLYGGMLKLLFTHILFALVLNKPLLPSLWFSLRRLPLLSGLALSIFGIAFVCGAIAYGVSIYWAGFWSIVIYLFYPLLQIGCKMWSIAAQYSYWNTEHN